ncbi:uncharacterized protein LOC128547830 [Mercenaria mercenaria]|uniref:uncharacterized protein LOC128547830 n=1 Tax=Mercenaria mercenaria TaxID=6596 RepID=UPI00234FAB11|nr:uncharacterized protein LOC128547830 [Mercenaria mercenaria]
MPRYFKVCSCSCPGKGSLEDLLSCAPCPPPMISYEEFRNHALNRSLLLKEVCIIARRCNINGTDIGVDCPPSTTIHTHKAGNQSGLFVFITVVPIIMLAVISIILFIKGLRKREIKSIYPSCIEKNKKNERSNEDKRIRPNVNVVGVKITLHTPGYSTDTEETTALINVVAEESKTITGNDSKGNKEYIHDTNVYKEQTEPVHLETNVQVSLESIPKENSDRNVQDNLEPISKANADTSVQEKFYPILKENSETNV